jgi:hypothetical protein
LSYCWELLAASVSSIINECKYLIELAAASVQLEWIIVEKVDSLLAEAAVIVLFAIAAQRDTLSALVPKDMRVFEFVVAKFVVGVVLPELE